MRGSVKKGPGTGAVVGGVLGVLGLFGGIAAAAAAGGSSNQKRPLKGAPTHSVRRQVRPGCKPCGR